MDQGGIARDEQGVGAKDPRIGQLIRGKYRLTNKLSAGEMGDLYAAQQLMENTSVVVKVFRPALSHDADFAHGLRQIMGVVWGLSKKAPDIVTIYECDIAEDGSVFVAMERVGGISLAELLRLEHPLKIERAVRLAGRIAGALGAVHMFGVVHGDIRPSNIIIGNDETTIKLVGFERARLQDVAPVALLERSGVLEAHFEYRSPEQIRDEEVTSLADVYGLGVLFYEMLTGRLPFSASTASALKIMHLSNPPWPLRELISDIPQMVEDKVLQALEKDPERRQNHIQDVANEYLYEKALYYEGARNGATGAEDGDPARTDAEEDLETVRPRRWGRDAVFAGLAILITIGGLWALGWLIDSEVSEYTPPRQELSLPPAPFSPVPPPVAAAPSAPEASSTAVQAGPKPTQESKETRPLGAPAQLRTSNAKTARKNLRAVPAPTSSPSDSRTPSAESAVGQPGADSQADPGAVIDWLLKKPLRGS